MKNDKLNDDLILSEDHYTKYDNQKEVAQDLLKNSIFLDAELVPAQTNPGSIFYK